jgi:hypothetical protein
LRAALNLPPANRPPLGKGPTGKDKPKSFDSGSFDGTHSHTIGSTSRESSEAASPSSTRTNSLSPATISATMRNSPRDATGIEGSQWEPSLLMGGDQQPEVPSTSSSYHLSSASTIPQKPLQYPYSGTMPPSSRTSSNSVYMPPNQPNYPHTADRPMGSFNASGFLVRDSRDESQHHHYSYSQPSFASHGATMESTAAEQTQPRDPPSGGLNFPHRRSLTDPQQQGFRINHFSSLPNPILSQNEITLPSPPRLQENTIPTRQNNFGGDGRLHSMP